MLALSVRAIRAIVLVDWSDNVTKRLMVCELQSHYGRSVTLYESVPAFRAIFKAHDNF